MQKFSFEKWCIYKEQDEVLNRIWANQNHVKTVPLNDGSLLKRAKKIARHFQVDFK